ncbi:flagellar assembly peptidoglycan hydrolase FlgJ [Bordetella petrii]|uniref:flagellar assembly peptidoglycan hydrolase FlgJ n=1 Tax=Bordetella petrii TaxID=94624 RepID=UPI003731BC8B
MAFVSYTPRPGAQQSVFDLGRLADIRRGVAADPRDGAARQQVATQVEALFLQMMLKRMREAGPKSGLFDSEQTQMLRAMADEQLALQLATPGVGLAQALLRQMRQEGGTDAALDGGAAPAEALAPAAGQPGAPQEPSRQVAALLEVLHDSRARDRGLAAAGGAPPHVIDFVARMAGPARDAARQSGLPARLILGQAALESGWGRRELKFEDGSTSYNLFGIKAGASWNGKVVEVLTTEYQDGVARKVVQPFRAYGSYKESFADYARLIGGSPRYAAVTEARDEIEAARRIQDAGYATDPAYAEKLIAVMGQLRGRGAAVFSDAR